MRRAVPVMLIVAICLSACESDSGGTRSPSIEEPVTRTASQQLDVMPLRRTLARSLGEAYRITSMEVRQERNGSDGPTKLVDVIARFKGPDHRRWSIAYEVWPSPTRAATEFKEEAGAAGADPPASALSRRYFCTSTDARPSSCTVLVDDVIMHVVPLPIKDQHDYPAVEHVTEVAGDAARILRTNP